MHTPTPEDLRLHTIERLQLLGNAGEPAFDRVSRLAATVFGAPLAGLSVVGAERQTFKSIVGSACVDVPTDLSPCAAVLRGDGVSVVDDLARDARFRLHPLVAGPPRARFYAGVPVHSPDQYAVGVLWVMDPALRDATPAQRAALADLGAMLERELMLRSMARTDPVTGVFNRGYLDSEIEREWRRALRHRLPVTAVKFDLDWFSDYNEVFGHPGGDAALRQTAAILSGQFRRAGDIVVRYEREQFLALLPETAAPEALRLAEQVRTRVQNLGLGHPGSPLGLLTMSAGCSTAENDLGLMRGYHQLLEEADFALSRAKQGGRNRVERFLVD